MLLKKKRGTRRDPKVTNQLRYKRGTHIYLTSSRGGGGVCYYVTLSVLPYSQAPEFPVQTPNLSMSHTATSHSSNSRLTYLYCVRFTLGFLFNQCQVPALLHGTISKKPALILVFSFVNEYFRVPFSPYGLQYHNRFI